MPGLGYATHILHRTLNFEEGLTMKIHTQPIQLSAPSSERTVKRLALGTFRAFRALSNQAQKVPGVLAQAGADIQSAWQDSARPNA